MKEQINIVLNYAGYLCHKYIRYSRYLLYREKVPKVHSFIGVNVIRDGTHFLTVLTFVSSFNPSHRNHFI